MTAFNQWLKETHPESYDESLGGFARKAALGVGLLAGGMGIHKMMSGNDKTPSPAQTQTQNQDVMIKGGQFVVMGYGHVNPTNFNSFEGKQMAYKAAYADAMKRLSKELGTNTFHIYQQETLENKEDNGVWTVKIRGFLKQTETGAEISKEMGN